MAAGVTTQGWEYLKDCHPMIGKVHNNGVRIYFPLPSFHPHLFFDVSLHMLCTVMSGWVNQIKFYAGHHAFNCGHCLLTSLCI